MSCCHPGTFGWDYRIVLQPFYFEQVCYSLFFFHKADLNSVFPVAKRNLEVFRFQNRLLAMRSSLLKAVLRQPTQCVRLSASTSGAVDDFKIEVGQPLSPSDRSGVPNLCREEVL